ncbi:MAG: hypothetical protein ABR606_04780 [Vicinamibacterales bacterium]
MTKPTNNPAPHAGETNTTAMTKDGETPGMARPPAETEDHSKKPSFSSTEDEPLATAGTGGSEDPKGNLKPGGGQVPADSADADEEQKREEKLSRDGTGF